MRSFRRRDRGLSEIVGTLILILIVVAAATLLAAFVASYQKQVQTEQSFAHDQSLESIHILSLNTKVNANGTAFTLFNFTLASEYINPSGVVGIFINNNPLKNYTWKNVITGATNYTNATDTLVIPPLGEVTVSLNLVYGTPGFSFFKNSSIPVPNEYIKFDIYTQLQNDFSRVFLPPAPLPVVSQINPSGNNPLTLLDGSGSFQPGGNSTLVNWGWTVSGGNLTSSATSLASTIPPTTFAPFVNGRINGSVQESVTGALATFVVPAGFNFTAPDAIEFNPTDNLAVKGSGTCDLAGSSVLPGPSGKTVGTTLTVTYNFTTNVSNGCTNATLSLAAVGIMLVTEPPQVIVVANGEQVEISPALPELTATQSPYVVTLVVTNSDGLVGTRAIDYSPPV